MSCSVGPFYFWSHDWKFSFLDGSFEDAWQSFGSAWCGKHYDVCLWALRSILERWWLVSTLHWLCGEVFHNCFATMGLTISKGGVNGWYLPYERYEWASDSCMLCFGGFSYRCVAKRWIRLWICFYKFGLLLWELLWPRFQMSLAFLTLRWYSAVFGAVIIWIWYNKWFLPRFV